MCIYPLDLSQTYANTYFLYYTNISLRSPIHPHIEPKQAVHCFTFQLPYHPPRRSLEPTNNNQPPLYRRKPPILPSTYSTHYTHPNAPFLSVLYSSIISQWRKGRCDESERIFVLFDVCEPAFLCYTYTLLEPPNLACVQCRVPTYIVRACIFDSENNS